MQCFGNPLLYGITLLPCKSVIMLYIRLMFLLRNCRSISQNALNAIYCIRKQYRKLSNVLIPRISVSSSTLLNDRPNSFAFKQGGFALNGNELIINRIRKRFRFSYSREYKGDIKMLRIKRSHLGEYYVYVITDCQPTAYGKSHDGASIGIDFGLKTYMTLSDGERIDNPQFLKRSIKDIRKASRRFSKCQKGSNHRERARLSYCRLQEKLVNKRTDFMWKLAHDLCRNYDYIFIEDLNLNGMMKMWGRKVSDLSHGTFINILEQVANKYDVVIHKIDRWYPSSKLCDCGYKNEKLTLRDREWICPQCGQIHDRDINAAKNILRKGISELVSNSKTNKASDLGRLRLSQESHVL